MKLKIICVLICIVTIITVITNSTMAGEQEEPEIVDDSFQIFDLTGRLNIISAWFDNDDTNLYVSIKMASIKSNLILGISVLWSYKYVDYYASFQNNKYYFGDDTSTVKYFIRYFPWKMKETSGNLDLENNIIRITVPLNEIGNPAEGEKLTNTWAMTHFSGMYGLNFYYPLDRAPKWGIWGKEYSLI